jgi:hypothetical protein
MRKSLRNSEGLKEQDDQPFLKKFIKFVTHEQFIWKVIPPHMKKP